MNRLIQLSCAAAAFAVSAMAVAQPSGYTGPSSKGPGVGRTAPANAPLVTAKDLLAKGKDDQYVKVQGRLVSHKGDEEYEFVDASGKMTVEIDNDYFPQGVKIDQNTLVELTGEFEKNLIGDSQLEVKQIKLVGK